MLKPWGKRCWCILKPWVKTLLMFSYFYTKMFCVLIRIAFWGTSNEYHSICFHGEIRKYQALSYLQLSWAPLWYPGNKCNCAAKDWANAKGLQSFKYLFLGYHSDADFLALLKLVLRHLESFYEFHAYIFLFMHIFMHNFLYKILK